MARRTRKKSIAVETLVHDEAKRLGIFHHDPEHDDVFMDKLADEAARAWDGAFVIQENMDFLVE